MSALYTKQKHTLVHVCTGKGVTEKSLIETIAGIYKIKDDLHELRVMSKIGVIKDHLSCENSLVVIRE